MEEQGEQWPTEFEERPPLTTPTEREMARQQEEFISYAEERPQRLAEIARREQERFAEQGPYVPFLEPGTEWRMGEPAPDPQAAALAAAAFGGDLSVADAQALDAFLATKASAPAPDPIYEVDFATSPDFAIGPAPGTPTSIPLARPMPTPTRIPEITRLPGPVPGPVPTPPAQEAWAPTPYDPSVGYGWDFMQFGGYSEGGMTMVGEEGPELVDLPEGAQVYPAGVTELLAGRPTRRPRSLFRPAGMRVPSAQAISNLLPEEMEVYQELGRLAGIPEKAFEREFRSAVPMGRGGTRQARFTPRQTGRTRYGTT